MHSAISGTDIPHVYGASLMIVLSHERLFHASRALSIFPDFVSMNKRQGN